MYEAARLIAKSNRTSFIFGDDVINNSDTENYVNSIINLAKTRGASSGLIAAEAFVLAREISK